MVVSGTAIDRFFLDWRGGKPRDPAAYAGEDWSAFRDLVAPCIAAGMDQHSYWHDPDPCSMHIGEVEAIWSAIDASDDWGPLHAKVAAIRRMGEALGPPPPLP